MKSFPLSQTAKPGRTAILHEPVSITLQCTVLHCKTIHYIALYCTSLHCNATHCIALHFTTLYCRFMAYGRYRKGRLISSVSFQQLLKAPFNFLQLQPATTVSKDTGLTLSQQCNAPVETRRGSPVDDRPTLN